MGIRVKLEHTTAYSYERPIAIGPQVIRLRPAPHCRTPIESYGLLVEPGGHFLNWQQDPFGNFNARLVFVEKAPMLRIRVELVADMAVINPFDFFVEESAERFPFSYSQNERLELAPSLFKGEQGALFAQYAETFDKRPRRTIDFLVDVNNKVKHDVNYIIRMEPGVQTCQETLSKRSGSCRDSAWLLVQVLRHFGLAARFVSGYLIQLRADMPSLDGPSGPSEDFCDLHAWTEVYLPGAGWIGLDPTSGLLAGEGHIPLAASPFVESAAPVTGCVEKVESQFHFSMSVTRVREDPRVTLPYSEETWQRIETLGYEVDERLQAQDVRLTMGGEPTFVSIDDMDGPEWTIAAVGPAKQRLSMELITRLKARFGSGGIIHYGQGKWYPGESLPRWAYTCLWRRDGEPLWRNPQLLATPLTPASNDVPSAGAFLIELADRLHVAAQWIRPAFEDPFHVMDVEQKLPIDWNPREVDLDDSDDRRRLANSLSRGLTKPVGFVLPIARAWWQARAGWTSGPWPFRQERLTLIPGDSPLGLRLPLDSLPRGGTDRLLPYTADPFADRDPLPGYEEIRRRLRERQTRDRAHSPAIIREQRRAEAVVLMEAPPYPGTVSPPKPLQLPENLAPFTIVSTALCVEPRNGVLHVFMPPLGSLEDYLELLTHVEDSAEALGFPVVIEGYLPPSDHRLQMIKVTPDPGVIEVNVQPSANWSELKSVTEGVYADARATRLGTEKFQLDGRHSGTGGGNHIVLGGPTPGDSPFLRRPDLLQSLLAYWNNHPSLSYVFSGLFIGPTSQAPRIDEGRRDAIYELELAFSALARETFIPPWLVDRTFRNLLVDLTGNTHRAEFCIDKLYSPDHANGRLGLVELRAFEMPPHARMSLAQQLLVRGIVAMFWETPYREKLVRWGHAIHDRFLLPEFLRLDLESVLSDLRSADIGMESSWFAPHWEFRCPLLGEVRHDGVLMELRCAIEPWYVLGEEPGTGGTARYVDSSVERVQLLVRDFSPNTHLLLCNGRPLPMHSTGKSMEYVAGVRYRAWRPPSCLHPNLPVNTPLSFEVVRRSDGCSMGGCQYFVEHPGGLNPSLFPVNALEAESRRKSRFWPFHKPLRKQLSLPELIEAQQRTLTRNHEFPCTLDLRTSLD